jgi:hypothetical protein
MGIGRGRELRVVERRDGLGLFWWVAGLAAGLRLELELLPSPE